MLKTFNCKPDELNLYSHHFVDPNFKVENFDINQPHTQIEWQCAFFSSLDAKTADKLPLNPVARVNLHTKAFIEYLKKKKAKGLLIT